jgi:hypothetical protein
MRWRKRMLEDLDEDIRDHHRAGDTEQHRSRHVSGRSALRGHAQIRERDRVTFPRAALCTSIPSAR